MRVLVPLDPAEHDVAAFTSGNVTCDLDLKAQAHKVRNRTLVMAEASRIIGFSRYSLVLAGADKDLMPFVRIDFVARDAVHGRGAGMEIMLRTFIRITKDPKTDNCRGVLIDSLNCDKDADRWKRWSFFTERVGFVPLKDNGLPYGYAFMSMETVRAIAEQASNPRPAPGIP